uniref:Uncharacterized protein n=1 Tax=Timema bartmani TaxID=61472 RepID=A0A7R9F1Z0_9NEOP|nr:unnamed protein product [Timema bartmani]
MEKAMQEEDGEKLHAADAVQKTVEKLKIITDRSCRLLALRGLLKKLPVVNFDVLKFVFQHFVKHKDVELKFLKFMGKNLCSIYVMDVRRLGMRAEEKWQRGGGLFSGGWASSVLKRAIAFQRSKPGYQRGFPHHVATSPPLAPPKQQTHQFSDMILGFQINLCRDGALNLGPSVQKSDTLPLDRQVTPGAN